LLLWCAPLLLIALGGISLAVFARRRAGKPTGTALTEGEQARLNELLDK
jgi:cytochrome c-type biogenesis protein CcmH